MANYGALCRPQVTQASDDQGSVAHVPAEHTNGKMMPTWEVAASSLSEVFPFGEIRDELTRNHVQENIFIQKPLQHTHH